MRPEEASLCLLLFALLLVLGMKQKTPRQMEKATRQRRQHQDELREKKRKSRPSVRCSASVLPGHMRKYRRSLD